jgi:hypothetical protein
MSATRRSILLALALALMTFSGAAACAEQVARLGMYLKIARDLNRADVRAAFDVWTGELTRKFQVPTQVRYYSDMPSLRRDFDSGVVNLVIADAMSFVRYFKADELADGFTTKLQHDASLLLLAKPGSGTKADLAGKRVARIEDDDIETTYLETLCLRQHGKECADLSVTFVAVPTNHQAVTRLMFGQVDLALVNRHGYELAIELNPQLARAGEPVASLAFDTHYFGFFSACTDPEFRRFALRSVPETHLEPRGRQLLEVFKTDRVMLADPSALKPFYELERDYLALKARSGRKVTQR